MADVKIPKLGENIEGAEVAAVLVAVGDTVEKDQSLLELESDKATVEIPSPFAGKVSRIDVTSGDEVLEGQTVMAIDSEQVDSSPPVETVKAEPIAVKTNETQVEAPATPPVSQAENQPQASGAVSVQDVIIPKLGENIDGAEVTVILVKVGDLIEADQTLLELESDKATVELPSPFSGKIQSISIESGQEVTAGQAIMKIESTSASPAKTSQPTAAAPTPKPAPQGVTEPHDVPVPLALSAEKPTLGNPAAAAPSVRRFARELGVNINDVKGSGSHGRISEDDVKLHVKAVLTKPVQVSAGSSLMATPALPDFSKWGEVHTERLSKVRRVTAQQMATAWNTIPHVTQFDESDISDIEVFRKGKGAKLAGGKLTVTAILLKITAMALKRFPKFNASLDLNNQQIVFKDYVHVGVAVDTPKGLLVPVIRDSDKKGIKTLSAELGEMAGKARDRKLSVDDMQGGTFTISNLGGLGTTYFTPIVNWPQVAILGVGRAKQTPVWQDGQFVPRMIMPLSLSYDHRIIDGADAARFLRWICMALEDPMIALLEGDI